MIRRGAALLGLAICLTVLHSRNPVQASTGAERQPTKTEWVVSSAPGLDALLLIGAASGDVLQKKFHAETITFIRTRMSPEGLAALERLDKAMRVEKRILTGPGLAYFFSTGPVDSLDAVMASADDPVGRLRAGHVRSPQWDEQDFTDTLKFMPDVAAALRALKEIGFEDWYDREMRPSLEAAIARLKPALAGYDLIPEQARLLGRPLEPRIELLVTRFARPYGIRITGQRFISDYKTDTMTQLRSAAHEIFHPPFNLKDVELIRLLKDLENDSWVRSIVENHDPKFGYNSFMGLINEDSTQALDQIVSQRLGFARDPGERWRVADGGMHMIAAALYQAMVEDGFPETGGVYEEWLNSALKRGILKPDEVRRRAAIIVGEGAVRHWFEVDAPRAQTGR